MTGETTVPLAGLDVDGVENVYIFVADTLRWDALPRRVADLGCTFRAAANGLNTPQSLPAIVSGRYPPRHGVTWFHHRMAPDLETLFDVEGTTAGYVDTEWDRPLKDVLRHPPEATVAEADPPFVVLEHDRGGHAPYPAMSDAVPSEIYTELSRDPDTLRRHYEEGVAASVDRFERRLATLEARGLLDETLVVFTSDHGELLGEYGGFVGHSRPCAPELVYVPMTVIHPSLAQERHTDVLVQLVDLLPTVKDVLDRPLDRDGHAYDGQSLLREVSLGRPSYTHGTVHAPEQWRDTRIDPVYEAPSVWTRGGGHVFNETSIPRRVLMSVYDGLHSGYTAAYNADRPRPFTLRSTLSMYLPGSRTFGEPDISREHAREFVDEVNAGDVRQREIELSEETKETLEDLGYV